jgi:hypothetical protein
MDVEFMNTTRPGPLSWGLGVGLALVLGCYGISLLLYARECSGQLDTTSVAKRWSVPNPGTDTNGLKAERTYRTSPNNDSEVHENHNAEADHRPVIIRPSDVDNEAGQKGLSTNITGEHKNASVISRQLTEFYKVSHADGEVLTGWEYENGYARAPTRQYCYYIAPHATEKFKSIKTDIAYDGSRLPGIDKTSVPLLEEALSKCHWWKG